MKTVELQLREISKNQLLLNVSMKNFTTFHTGGKALYVVFPQTIEQVLKVFEISKKHVLPVFVLGKASNVLISDEGFPGIIIVTTAMTHITTEKEIIAECGVLISALLRFCIKNKLSGFEFLAGIPGTLGGAVFVNAGLKKDWILSHVEKLEVIDKNLNITHIARSEIQSQYRKSNLDTVLFVWKIYLSAGKNPANDIKKTVSRYIRNRLQTQPLGLASAGSIFRNPPDCFAGKLIEQCGLKETSVGGAQISAKHANFIVNTGNATSSEIYALIRIIQEKVKKKYNVILEPEIKIIGKFP